MVNLAKLEKVLGCTVVSSCAVSVDEQTGLIAYPASSTVVLHNPKTNNQAFLVGSAKNSLSCLAFSKCGKYLVTGEFGHDPRVRVWEVYDTNGHFSGVQLAEFLHHEMGIVCVRFALDGEYVVSVGNKHDRRIALWKWKANAKVAENRTTSIVRAMDINEAGTICVTVGVRHVKFWYLDDKKASLQGRSAILADQRNNTFIDVRCGPNNRTFSLTITKLLIEFKDKKLINTYHMHDEAPLALSLGENVLYIGFKNGTIRCMDANTMERKMTYCKPHYLFCDVASGSMNDSLLSSTHPKGSKYPDVRALCYNQKSNVLTAFYNDRSIYSWQETNDGHITKLSSQIFHVGPIFGIEMFPPYCNWLQAGSFITGGADETIRIWNIDQRGNSYEKNSDVPSVPQTNVFSEELKKIIFVSKEGDSLTENPDNVMTPLIDLPTGVKCLKVSPDGKHLATGGRGGDVIVYDLTKSEMSQIVRHEAHENDVMCLDYSDPCTSRYLMASGGRDRLIHIYDPLKEYEPLATVDDHTSTVNSIVFRPESDGLKLTSCAADKTIVIRKLVESSPDSVTFERMNQATSQFGLNYLIRISEGMLAACQDRQLRAFSTKGKLIRQVNGAVGGDGQLTKVRIDPSSTFAAAVCSDRHVYLIETSNGECTAVLPGQSDMVSDVGFTFDCRRLIVVTYSGCIFIWRLSTFLTNKMNDKLKKAANSTFNSTFTVEKVNDRVTTPDSLIGSGSDITSEECARVRQNNIKDSESEFGSLNSVHIADDDNDSCIGQKPPKIILNQADIEDPESSEFEVKKISSEVVRRNSLGPTSHQNSPWDISSSPGEETEGTNFSRVDEAELAPRVTHTYTSSRSMSNLRPTPPTTISMLSSSPRRPRKKWDVSSDGYGAPPRLDQLSSAKSTYSAYDISSLKSSVNNVIPAGGFMTMTGTDIYHSPARVPQRSNVETGSQSVANVVETFSRLNMPPNNVNDVSTTKTASNGEIPYRSSLMSTMGSPQKKPSHEPFSRANINRVSLTKRFFNNSSAVIEKPRTVWNPPSMAVRRTTSSMHYWSPMSPSASAIVRRNDDYATSDLHLRSRSQSPSRLALNASVDSVGMSRHQRQDSDMSAYSTVTMTSTRLTPSSSRSNLRTVGTTLRQSTQTLNKLNEVRDKLRKSQENLSNAIGSEQSISKSSTMISRSKSIGNLRTNSTVSATDAQNAFNVTYPGGTFNSETDGGIRTEKGSSPFSKSRSLAKSVGSLQNQTDMDDVASEECDTEETNLTDTNRNIPRKLAQTIMELKKASNPDLTHASLYEDVGMKSSEYSSGEIYRLGSAGPQRSRGKGAVQKRVERYHPRTRVSRDTTSGESDSNASETVCTISSSNRSPSNVEGFSRTGMLPGTRRIFEQQRHNSTINTTPRRAPNYLAQKLASGEMVGPDTGADECCRQSPVLSNDMTALNNDDTTKDSPSRQMARHIKECLDQYRTVVDKLLQARRMLLSSSQLPEDDRDVMLKHLDNEIKSGCERLGDRNGSEDSSSSLNDPQPNSGVPSGTPLNPVMPNISTTDVDSSAFLQHVPQLIALLRQNMAKQN